MCITKELLAEFYGDSAFFAMRTLIHYRVLATYGKPFDYFLVKEPWLAYEVLEKTLGRHNAELFLRLLTDWLRKNGCNATPEEVRRALSDRSAWRR
ncbi:MAG: hypothetical protein LM562_05610 [Pyrobaculum sp.]|nr:hypothetical protein [Pyrobaculum sp.]